MLSPEAAWEKLETFLAARPAAASETVARTAARGRVLARDLVATTDVPTSDISALDGFAFAGDPGSGTPFAISGTALAGAAAAFDLPPLEPGAARRIMTGAPVPPGADRVLGFEDVEILGSEVRRLAGGGAPAPSVPMGAAIRRRGEIVRAGEALLAAGTTLSPAACALLASQGIENVVCRRLPRVALLVTGDEVRRGGEVRPGEVRDSHSDFVAGELGKLGLAAATGDIVRDDPRELETRLAQALDAADVVLTCGGVSMGDADLVPPALERLGCETLFHGVAIQPGKPLLAAKRGGALVFGLPGNPGSVMTGYWLFVKPALKRLGGEPGNFWGGAVAAKLIRGLGAGRGRDRFVPAKTVASGGVLEALSLSPKGSHDLLAFATADALLRVRRDDPPRAAGESCALLLLND
jgi:molybdopterin molybdotransferase